MKKIICKVLSVLLCCGFVSNVVYASSGMNFEANGLNEMSFEQLDLSFGDNGELLKDVSVVGGTYLYRVNEKGHSLIVIKI